MKKVKKSELRKAQSKLTCEFCNPDPKKVKKRWKMCYITDDGGLRTCAYAWHGANPTDSEQGEMAMRLRDYLEENNLPFVKMTPENGGGGHFRLVTNSHTLTEDDTLWKRNDF